VKFRSNGIPRFYGHRGPQLVKRVLDVTLSGVALIFLSPLLFLIVLLIKLDSIGPVFFKQARVGKNFRSFRLIKFRSMTVPNDETEGEFNPGDETRVTKVGAFLRRTKLDELPELFNVLNGDMSIVGSRPEVERYVRMFPEAFEYVLRLKPGLSDFASIKYRKEEEILSKAADADRCYVEEILPDKLRLAKEYIQRMSLRTDINIIANTIKTIFRSKDTEN
jgi:lipopolysaccharide/colanic/teichoic acid biosynthesis glycosyltransferase